MWVSGSRAFIIYPPISFIQHSPVIIDLAQVIAQVWCQVNEHILCWGGFAAKYGCRKFICQVLNGELVQWGIDYCNGFIDLPDQFRFRNSTQGKLQFSLSDIAGMSERIPNKTIEIADQVQGQISCRIGDTLFDVPDGILAFVELYFSLEFPEIPFK